MNIIRKISVGSNYKEAMHYIVGQPVLRGNAKITLIHKKDEEYKIWIQREDEVVCWKGFNENMPISIEYDINF